MKKYLLGAAAALAIAAPAVAHADSGGIGVHETNIDSNFSSDAYDVYGLDFNYTHNMDGGMAIQGEGASDRLDGGGGHIGLGYVAASIGAHQSSYSFYGYLGHTDLLYLGDAFDVGVGGQFYGSNFTVNGSVGYADYDFTNVTNVSADFTWFFTDDLGLKAQAGYETFSDGGPDISTYGIGLDWRITGSPVDLSVGYQKADEDADADIWKIGLSYQFGTHSLREESQSHWNGAQRQYDDVKDLF
jgi:hypothetical protein